MAQKKKAPIPITYILVGLLVVAAFLLGTFWTKIQFLEKQNVAPSPTPQATAPNAPVLGARVEVDMGHFPVLGNKNAKVTVIEFADFQCPFCERFFTDVGKNLIKDYVDTGKIKFAFRSYAFLGQESIWAAQASECANEQGRFWEMHDYLFTHQMGENQGAFSKENLKGFAIALNLNSQKFDSCLDLDKYKEAVEKDLTAGKNAGVNGTPGTFVNGQLVVGAQPYSNFKAIIDAELKK